LLLALALRVVAMELLAIQRLLQQQQTQVLVEAGVVLLLRALMAALVVLAS
jgi:hypothetical protein